MIRFGPRTGFARGSRLVTYQRITMADPLYEKACRLRERVLLEPIGMTMQKLAELYPGFEEQFEHFVAVTTTPGGERVIGCALLLPKTDRPGFGKLMQMAVDHQRQGEGIGQRLVIEAESRAFGELGLEGLFCYSQKSATGFYEKLGWEGEGDEFVEAGIPHLTMIIRRPPVEASEEPIPAW